MPRYDYVCENEGWCPAAGLPQEVVLSMVEVCEGLHDHQLCMICRTLMKRLPHYHSTQTVIPVGFHEHCGDGVPEKGTKVRKTWDERGVQRVGSGKALRRLDETDD